MESGAWPEQAEAAVGAVQGTDHLQTNPRVAQLSRGRPPARQARGARRARGPRQGRGRGENPIVKEGSRARGRRRLSFGQVTQQKVERRRKREQRIRLNEIEVRRFLQLVAERQPALLLDIWEGQDHREGPVQMEQPHWCTCGKCRSMPTPKEEVCCRGGLDDCITLQPEMDYLVLDPMVLELARLHRDDMMGRGRNAHPNKRMRHTAYRQFILWQHGRLGRGNRQVVPNCAVLKTSEQYPDPHGQYTGYIPSRLL